jgi:hypothetical protein
MSEFSRGASFGQEEMSLGERLIRVLYAPHRSFAAVAGREQVHDWLLPALLACAAGLVAHSCTIDLITDLQSPVVQQQMEQLGEAEQEQYIQSLQVMRAQGWMMVPIGVFSSLVIVAGVALLFTRQFFSSEITYRQMLVAKAYASLVLIPEWLVRTLLMRARGTPQVHTGPGVFVGEEMAGGFFGRLLLGINLFDLWQLWILGVGVAVMARAPEKKVLAGLLLLWLLWISFGAAIEGMAPRPDAIPGP